MNFNKQKISLVAVSAALIIAVGYIVFDQYQAMMMEEQLSAYRQGAQEGYSQAVFQLLQQARTCEQVPVTFGNVTLNLIAVECLQPATTE